MELVHRLTFATLHLGKEVDPYLQGLFRSFANRAIIPFQHGQSAPLLLLGIRWPNETFQNAQDARGSCMFIDLCQALLHLFDFGAFQFASNLTLITKLCNEEEGITT
jgi:hypothetical protein